jgi:maltooligosyltrehalose trehalohydrolase
MADSAVGERLGAWPSGDDRWSFRVWAPSHARVAVRLEGEAPREVPLVPEARGYHAAVVEGVRPGDRYRFRLGEDLLRPDPASRAQPGGVHEASMLVDPAFPWTDAAWRGLPLADYVFYELHVGTFTREGTFDAAIAHLDDLLDLGITCVEIMPVAAFPGTRNWGYDGVLPYAAQWSYGGLDGLRRLVDACHGRGLAVCLDVVYNHLGPEGNYLRDFGPYFTGKYTTPWGEALNFDEADSDEVRRFFLENVRFWIEDVHIDALRLDAVHAIFDQSARPFLAEIGETARALGARLGRAVQIVAESDLHDPRMVRPEEAGGYGLDAEWNDDLHHAVHALLTGERRGYYADFGRAEDLARAYEKAYAHAGTWTAYRRRRHGAPADGIAGERFVVCAQNHDQVGNRLAGERLAALVSFESLKLAAGTILLSPYLPLLFMGEEYGEIHPFLYFVDHGDGALREAVRNGRAAEFAAFDWAGDPPDPASAETFEKSRLDRRRADSAEGRALEALYRALLRLRREHPALGAGGRSRLEARADEKRQVVTLRRWAGSAEALAVFHFGEAAAEVPILAPAGRFEIRLDSASRAFGGVSHPPPEPLFSDGELRLSMAGRSFLLLDRQES